MLKRQQSVNKLSTPKEKTYLREMPKMPKYKKCKKYKIQKRNSYLVNKGPVIYS